MSWSWRFTLFLLTGVAFAPAKIAALVPDASSIGVTSAEQPAGSGSGPGAVANADGCLVAFTTRAALTASPNDDSNQATDVYVRDRCAGVTERASIGPAQRQGNAASTRPAISDDGCVVAFESDANNFDDTVTDTNNVGDVYLRDRCANTTELISRTPANHAGNRRSFDPVLSTDGCLVAFVSEATDLTDEPATGGTHLFVRDRCHGTIDRLADMSPLPIRAMRVLLYHGNAGVIQEPDTYASLTDRYQMLGADVLETANFPNDLSDFRLVFIISPGSTDGTPASFFSDAQVAALRAFIDGGGRLIVLGENSSLPGASTVNDLLTRLDTRVRVNLDHLFTTACGSVPVTNIAADPLTQTPNPVTSVTFSDAASVQVVNGSTSWPAAAAPRCLVTGANQKCLALTQQLATGGLAGDVLLVGDSNVFADQCGFMRDTSTTGNRWLAANLYLLAPATAPRKQLLKAHAFDQAGHVLVFTSDALLNDDANSPSDVFAIDLSTHQLEHLSRPLVGTSSGGRSYGATISADGCEVAFISEGATLVSGDTNGVADIFVRNRCAGTLRRVLTAQSTQPNGTTPLATITASGRLLAFESDATNWISGDTNALRDVFVQDLVSGATERASVGVFGQIARLSLLEDIADAGRLVVLTSAQGFWTVDKNQVNDVYASSIAIAPRRPTPTPSPTPKPVQAIMFPGTIIGTISTATADVFLGDSCSQAGTIANIALSGMISSFALTAFEAPCANPAAGQMASLPVQLTGGQTLHVVFSFAPKGTGHFVAVATVLGPTGNVVASFSLQAQGLGIPTATSTPSVTRTATATRTFTRTATPSASPTDTGTPTRTQTPSNTRRPTNTFTPSPSRIPTRTASITTTPSPTASATLTVTRSPSRTPSASPSVTPTITDTPPPTSTRTLRPTATTSPTFTATDTRTPSVTATASNTRIPTRTFSPSPTVPPTRTRTETATATFTKTPTLTPTATNSPIPSNTRTPTITPTATPSQTLTNTRVPSRTRTETPSPTSTRTPSNTPTQTPTLSPTATPTLTFTRPPTRTVTASPTLTIRPTETASRTRVPSKTPTFSPTPSPSRTPTESPLPTITNTRRPTVTVTRTHVPSHTATGTVTLSPTRSRTATISRTPTITLTPTVTATATVTSTVTATETTTPTMTETATETATETPGS